MNFGQGDTQNDHTDIGKVHLSLFLTFSDIFKQLLYKLTTLRPGVALPPAARYFEQKHKKLILLSN